MAMMDSTQGSDERKLPGVPLPSGFEYGRKRAPLLSKEAMARVQAKIDSVAEARRRAMEGASTYVIG